MAYERFLCLHHLQPLKQLYKAPLVHAISFMRASNLRVDRSRLLRQTYAYSNFKRLVKHDIFAVLANYRFQHNEPIHKQGMQEFRNLMI